jgi:tetratricopeptide (TPR) repeat protein
MRKHILLVSGLALALTGGVAAAHVKQSVESGYQETKGAVEETGNKIENKTVGKMEAPQHVDMSTADLREASRLATASANQLMLQNYSQALTLADQGLAIKPNGPWLLYDRGMALAGLGRTDEALCALQRAENNFTFLYGKQVAAYGRAITLENAGRCEQSAKEFNHYAFLVRNFVPNASNIALAHVTQCRTRAKITANIAVGIKRPQQPARQPVAGHEPKRPVKKAKPACPGM